MEKTLKCKKAIRQARIALLIMLGLSVLNLGWVLYAKNTFFVAVPALPEIITLLGIAVYSMKGPLYLIILCGVGVSLFLIAYLLCGILGKKRSGWMTAALVLYGVDYVFRLYLLVCDLYAPDDLLRLILRILIPTVFLAFLIQGAVSQRQLRRL